jgi:hypothetical protein
VAKIIPYDIVLHRLLNEGFNGLYHNSGSFGFARDAATFSIGWIGPADPTIRAEAIHFTRAVKPPHAENLTDLTIRAWQGLLGGPVWVLPRSHWAYELDFGSAAWMPGALSHVGIGSSDLPSLAKGEAIEFAPEESNQFGSFLRSLLDNLSGSSDFQLVWPEKHVLCTVHHHQQLWWTAADELLQQSLAAMAPMT